MTPRVLFLDIETAPATGFFWGHTHETDIIKVLASSFILSYAYQWMHEEEIHFKGLPDYPLYKENLSNDFFLLQDLKNLMDAANVIIAHNGDRFDIRTIQGRFIRYNIGPPSPFKQLDTLKVCQSQFRLESNRLDFVAQYLGIGAKLPHTGLDLWERCMKGDLEAWETMEQYNKHDVYLLKEVYHVIRPYIKNHPNLNLFVDTTGLEPPREPAPPCPVCLSHHTKRAGRTVLVARQYQQFKCLDCGKYYKGGRALPIEKKLPMRPPLDNRPPCPHCQSLYVNKCEHLLTRKGKFYQYKCRECGKQFKGEKVA